MNYSVTLANGKTLEVNAVEERYAKDFGGASGAQILTIEAAPVFEALEYYSDMFINAAALETISVTCEGKEVATFHGYVGIADITLRLLPDGKQLIVTLRKPVGETE